ncbi:uncharacterized protein BDZ99DRAFT_85702 [Mytilinidion resinicola]|uniref:Uncharacterized protein n=1 Tax=Mytilinidion resinicola TaxID=574789 RepID=A0A6A6YD95_9PEZI|nr:uncharacterized protein BDZ99DRAFT_85702 [Mytilinidion resinicola]KAF2806796.1 hypothetical protein BDZ99DRAFT_85702 [Mytilinidion resinicola]
MSICLQFCTWRKLGVSVVAHSPRLSNSHQVWAQYFPPPFWLCSLFVAYSGQKCGAYSNAPQ